MSYGKICQEYPRIEAEVSSKVKYSLYSGWVIGFYTSASSDLGLLSSVLYVSIGFYFIFETGSFYIDIEGLELTEVPLPPESWG